MSDVLDALGVQRGDCVAVVGAGGKTTLCWRMVQAFAARGERVAFTTTTRIWQPAAGVFDRLVISPHPSPLPEGEGVWRTACIASAIEGEPSSAQVAHAGMPTVRTKLIGFSPDDMCALYSTFHIPHSTFVIEADGARGLLLKAPADYEPAIPPCANVVCVVASLDAIGRPLDERTVHRVERVARIAGARAGSAITAAMIVDVLSHPEGGLKNMPAHAQRVAVLTQRNAHSDEAAPMLAQLRARSYHRAVLCHW
jgi:molybdenum cofactor cytidylyltransferase